MTARIDVSAETLGYFSTQYLAENGRRIPVIGQISINGCVNFLGISADAWGCGLLFIENVRAPTVLSGWGDCNTVNQNWGVTLRRPFGNITVALGSTVPDRPSYMTWSPENPRVAACRIRDDFCHISCCYLDRRRSIIQNPIINMRFNRHGDDREGLVTQ